MLTVPGYQVQEKLYESSRSRVYRGRRAGDERTVILKVLNKAYPTPEELARFKLEYEIVKNLTLDGVVRAYSLKQYKNSLLFSMEDFGGVPLTTLIRQHPVDLEAFLTLAIRIVQILGAIHQEHIMHKDLNPSNILYNAETDQVKIIDFGISTVLSREKASVRNPDVLEGTLAYMSPEQTGRMNRAMDYRTDFYSLGVTFYELLTGQRPFQMDDAMALVHAHIAIEPPPPHRHNPAIPAPVSALVLKLLAKTAEERYQSAYGLQVDLETCQSQWQANGHIAPFRLGRQDVSDRFQIPEKLYGREQEIATLLAAFDRVSEGPTALMLVAGAPGIGKSSLVSEVHKPIVQRRGYFIAGKFDQLQRNIPYYALIQAFQELIQQILTENEERIAAWKAKLLEAFSINGQIVVDVIPEVELIVGKQPPVPKLGLNESQNRFNLTFQQFVGVFAQQEHPMVLFLDDLQWADASSLKLINLLMTDPGSQYLFMIGAYRDNEVDAGHPLRLTLDTLSKADVLVEEITLSPLGREHIEHILTDTLHSDPAHTEPLAALLLRKTNGNPFFLNQFLTSLYQEQLLTFDARDGRWMWDITQIDGMGLTDNVVELMAGKIQKLGAATQQALQLAACIGSPFDLKTLSTVLEKPPVTTAADLWEAAQEDLIRPIGDTYKLLQEAPDETTSPGTALSDQVAEVLDISYRFLHDRVQQAAYTLISDDHKEEVHLKIGHLMKENIEEAEQTDKIFDIVNHLNIGRALITQQDEKDELARLNLVAGRKAKAATAYETARIYLSAGTSLLNETCWQTQHDLTLALHTEATEAALLSTDFEQTHRLADVVLEHARSPLAKAKTQFLLLQSYMAQHKMPEAVETACIALKPLGVHLPENPTAARTLAGALNTRRILRGKSFETLSTLPPMTDPLKEEALRLLSEVVTPTYYIKAKLHPFVVYNMVKLTIDHGNTPLSWFAYTMWGILLCGPLNDIEAGYRYGEISMRMLEQSGAKEMKGRGYMTYYFAIKLWKDPLRESLEPFLEGYQSSLDTGTLMYAALNLYAYCICAFFAGLELDGLGEDMKKYRDKVRKIKQETLLTSIEIFGQSVENLRGKGRYTKRLIGDFFNEEERVPFLIEVNDYSNLNQYYLNKAMLCYLFNDPLQALENAVGFEKNADALESTLYVPEHYFYYSLALLASYPELPGPEQEQGLKQVASNQKKMKEWARHAPKNYQHKYDLVEAERMRVRGQTAQAIDAYDRAIAGARDTEYTHEEALAGELAGRFYLAQGKTSIARAYLLDARHTYLRWGAAAKVEEMDEHYAEILAQALGSAGSSSATAPRRSTTTTGSHSADALDLTTVMKASQALSGEIVLERLLEAMMNIVLENAGAQKGMLILDDAGRLVIEATGEVEQEDIDVLLSIPVEASQDLSAAIINYVARTQEYVVLDDAAHEGVFTQDPYIVAHQPKSILCAPLLNQGNLAGILYLENNLTSGAFTPDRIEVLRLLSSQIAISIENARLYNNLEQKVEERTEELRQSNRELESAYRHLKTTQARLIQAEKMASLGQLTAGIAHEIKNPLNFVNNFAIVSVDLADELIEELQKNKDKSVAEISGDLEAILDDLKITAGHINKHGKRADGIVKSMMEHARATPGKREPTDVNALLEEFVNLAYHGMRSQRPDFNVTLEKDYDPALEKVEVVSQEIGRVFINLLNNAFDALHEKAGRQDESYRPTVSVRTRRENGTVTIAVQDNGMGIPPTVKDKIFEPFFTTKPTGTGNTGLGLSLSYDIVVQGHGGGMRVESEEGEGATFVITLPIA